MKYRELLNETLKLMGYSEEHDIALMQLEDIEADPNMADYVHGMYGSLNRCFSEIENKGVLPNSKHNVEANELLASGYTLRFDTTQVADMLQVVRVIDSGGYYDNDVDFIAEGTDIVLPMLASKNHHYIILYKARIPRVSINTAEDYEIEVPDYIANYIPYYLKGDLYRGDEPAESNQALNFFEQAMYDLMPKQTSRQTSVDLVYNMENMS